MTEYKPSENQKPPSNSTKSAGSRGCLEVKMPLVILSPITHVGYTASGRPTFVWFLDNPYNIKFRVFEFEPNGGLQQIGEPINLQASKGINKYLIPEDHLELVVGKYLWQVSIYYPDVLDTPLIQEAEFRVVEMSSDLKSKLPITTDSFQKANLYAEQGLWYDALKEALKLAPKGKLGEVGSTLVQSLAQSEEQEGQSQELQQRVESLKAIANQEK